MIQKGKVSSILDNGNAVTVTPYIGGTVTDTLTVPFFLRGALEVGTPVVYVSFEDNTGTVLTRMDGEWSHKLDGDLTVAGDVSADGVSLKDHTHTYSMGGGTTGTTSAPQ